MAQSSPAVSVIVLATSASGLRGGGTKPEPCPSPTKKGSFFSSLGGSSSSATASVTSTGASPGSPSTGGSGADVSSTKLAGSTSTHGSKWHWTQTLSASCGGPSHRTSPSPMRACPSTRSAFT